ncbi:hypothetical protein BX600DRAFT_474899 [Xylariales sp. PMI_506]|nr:hypothetical protein BX600DRAFT_474899 [Xylariales sp. PMI_506]
MNAITTTTLVAAAGIVSSSMFLAMNYTINLVAFPLVFLGEVPKSTDQHATSSRFLIPATNTPSAPVSLINRQWKEMYERGSRGGIATSIVSGLAFLGAAYVAWPISSEAACLFVAAALFQMSAGPYTWFVILPTNEILHRRADDIGAGRAPTIKSGELDTISLIKKWLGMNKTRANLAVASIGLGIAGLIISQL